MELNQGDIIKIDGISTPVFVASTQLFNEHEMILGCPILKSGKRNAFHYPITFDKGQGIVYCEQIRYFDLKRRPFSYYSFTELHECMEIVDTIQGFFDYSVGQL